MNPIRIFISSVQTEFAQERAALSDYLRGDPLMRRFFDVFLFEDVPASDRLEVLNPGRFPPALTLEQLRQTHPSVPNNRLLARPLYLAQYIEEMGTGTLDIIRRCNGVGLPEPEFTDSGGFKITIWRATSTEQIKVQPELRRGDIKSRVLNLLTDGPRSRSELSKQLGQKKPTGHLYNVIRALLDDQMIEYTFPDKPRSRGQQYQLTDKGRTELSKLKSGNAV